MFELHSALNPVARIHAKPESKIIQDSHFFGEDSILRILRICIGCRVSICARTINPNWALFNGSIGVVINIVFASDQSPQNRDLLLYVLIDFN
jgi:ATP-dependent exoDNAse (exonuclease V) alpha subunit